MHRQIVMNRGPDSDSRAVVGSPATIRWVVAATAAPDRDADRGQPAESDHRYERCRVVRSRLGAVRHRSDATYGLFFVVASGDGRLTGGCSIMLHHELLRQ
jgi:hypothetical protein